MSLLPTKDDLKNVPLRALVGYAARCALRVESMFLADSKNPNAPSSRKSVETAIQTALDFAAGNRVTEDAVSKLEDQVAAALEIATDNGEADKASVLAGNATYAAINAAHLAIQSVDSDDPTENAEALLDAVTVGIESAASADVSVAQSAGMDWVLLSRQSLGEFPLLGEPINVREDGPLGPLFVNLLRERRMLQAEQEKIDIAKQNLEPELQAMREERTNLDEVIKKLKLEEDELRQRNDSVEDKMSLLKKEKESVFGLAHELREMLGHWAEPAKT